MSSEVLSEELELGNEAPDFTLQNQGGSKVTLSTLRKKEAMYRKMKKSIAGVVAGLMVLTIIGTAHAVVLQSWDQQLIAGRFLPALGTTVAVLDNETQLVWERSPNTLSTSWEQALLDCYSKNVGGRKGWRLPTVEELFSLVAPTVAFPGPTLPVGHPFLQVQKGAYWSGTRIDLINTTQLNAWGVNFSGGTIASGQMNGSSLMHVWCVRGGHGHDGSQSGK